MYFSFVWFVYVPMCSPGPTQYIFHTSMTRPDQPICAESVDVVKHLQTKPNQPIDVYLNLDDYSVMHFLNSVYIFRYVYILFYVLDFMFLFIVLNIVTGCTRHARLKSYVLNSLSVEPKSIGARAKNTPNRSRFGGQSPCFSVPSPVARWPNAFVAALKR